MHSPSAGRSGDTLVESTSHKAIIVLCMIITIIEGYNLIIFGSVVPLLIVDPSVAVTSEAIGLIGGIVSIGAIIGSLLAGILSDRIGKKNVLVGAVLVFATGAFLSGLATSADMLTVARFLAGLGVGGALTTAMTVARNHASARRASLVVTVTMAGIPLGGVIASLLAIPLLPTVGWRPMFFIGGALAVAIAIAVIATRIGTENPQDIAGRAWSLKDKQRSLFTGRGLQVAIIICVCAIANMVAWQGLNVWAAQAMTDLGYSLTIALLAVFALTGAAVVGSFISAAIADRHGAARAAVGTSACTVIGLVGILVAPQTLATTLIFVAMMGIGGHSTMNLVHSTTANIYPLAVRNTALGWSNGTSFIGAFLGPAMGGVAFASAGATGLFSVFAVAAAVCLAAVVGLFLMDRKVTHESFHQPTTTADVAPVPATPAVVL